jgi:hypothetical protein
LGVETSLVSGRHFWSFAREKEERREKGYWFLVVIFSLLVERRKREGREKKVTGFRWSGLLYDIGPYNSTYCRKVRLATAAYRLVGKKDLKEIKLEIKLKFSQAQRVQMYMSGESAGTGHARSGHECRICLAAEGPWKRGGLGCCAGSSEWLCWACVEKLAYSECGADVRSERCEVRCPWCRRIEGFRLPRR